jgi:hypothetical protein
MVITSGLPNDITPESQTDPSAGTDLDKGEGGADSN